MKSTTCPRCHLVIPGKSPQNFCPNCGSKVDSSAPEMIHSPASPRVPPPPPPTPQELQPLFPHLEIVRLIGRGGMGAVYEARQRGLNRTIALKILWAPAVPDALFEERFAREGHTLARLSHDHIVAVHDAGRSGPYYWLLMEYVDGPSLRQLLQGGPVEPGRALDIVMQMCGALQFAHQQGVVHRDIKPENILITRDGRVKIADFGLAKILETQQPDARLTRSEQAMGTPHYMAPEQLERPKDVDHRADIYSLGVVFYEVLTGELPLGRFLLPSRRVKVDQRLDDIVVKTLQREPERRYQAASEVRTAVHSVLKKPPVVDRRPAMPRRRRLNIGMLVGVAAVVGLAAWVVSSNYDVLFAREKPHVLTAQDHIDQGTRLRKDPATLQQALEELERAHELDPSLAQSTFLETIQQSLNAMVADDAVHWAAQAAKISPSTENDDMLAQASARAQEAWASEIATTPKNGDLLTAAPDKLEGTTTRSDVALFVGKKQILISKQRFRESFSSVEGPNTIELAVRLPRGDLLPVPIRFTLDTKPPMLKVVGPAENSCVQDRFRVSGTVEDAADPDPVVFCNDVAASVDAERHWSAELRLLPGKQAVKIVARDRSRHESPMKMLSVIVDVNPPTAFLFSRGGEDAMADTQEVAVGPNQSTLSDRIRVEDDLNQLTAKWDGGKINVDDKGMLRGLELKGTGAEPETHELRLRDQAGNEKAYSVLVRRDAEQAIVNLEPSDTHVISGQTFQLRGTFKDLSPCRLVLSGRDPIPLWGTSFHVAIPIDEHTRPTFFHIIDDAGNSSQRIPLDFALVEKCKDPNCVILPDGEPGHCKVCNGTGRDSASLCPTCKGKKEHQVACTACKVTGGKEPCPDCGGDGRLPATACEKCHGKKTVDCERCNGSGKIREKCLDCGGTRRYRQGLFMRHPGDPCRTCKDGFAPPRDCPNCDGNKRVRCPMCKVDILCKTCKGSGHLMEACRKCHGRKSEMQPCDKCSATGDKPDRPCLADHCLHGWCRSCGGRGWGELDVMEATNLINDRYSSKARPTVPDPSGPSTLTQGK